MRTWSGPSPLLSHLTSLPGLPALRHGPHWAVAMVGAFEIMAERLPPPYEPPLAPGYPPYLKTFLYLLMRDYIPAGFVEGLVAQAVSDSHPIFTNEHLADYAERLARQLSYDASSEIAKNG